MPYINPAIHGCVIAYFLFSNWRLSAILACNICRKKSNFCLYLHRYTKFGEDRTIRGRVIAYFRFSRWRPSAILDLVRHLSGPPMIIVFDGPNILLELHIHRVNILRDIAIFIFGPFGLKLPIHAHFGGVLGIWRGSPWNWVPAQGVNKARVLGLSDEFSRFDTIPACDRQTARQPAIFP